MKPRIVVPPSDEPVTLGDLKEQLRIDHGEEDALLTMKITAARQHIENLTGLAIPLATYEFRLDRFPAAEIKVPRAPLVSVASVNFVGPDGIEAQVDAGSYEVDTASPEGWIAPVSGFSWPSTMQTINAVRVRFVAGYEDVPETLKEAILQLAAWWYESREAVADEARVPVPFSVQELVAEHREWTF